MGLRGSDARLFSDPYDNCFVYKGNGRVSNTTQQCNTPAENTNTFEHAHTFLAHKTVCYAILADVGPSAPERSLLEKPLRLSEDPLKPLFVPSPPPPLLDKSKCFSKECLPEVSERNYLKEYSDPHGYVSTVFRPRSEMTIVVTCVKKLHQTCRLLTAVISFEDIGSLAHVQGSQVDGFSRPIPVQQSDHQDLRLHRC
eukprot:1196077-Prorocentrum_minimum.AAC.3